MYCASVLLYAPILYAPIHPSAWKTYSLKFAASRSSLWPERGWHGILAPSQLATGDEAPKKKRVRSRERKGRGAHERGVGSSGDGAQANREERGGRGLQAEASSGPEGAVEQELGTRLPEDVRVETVEESAETIYLVLPSTPMAGREGGELSDRELESVAGGAEGWIVYDTIDENCYYDDGVR